MLRSKYTMIRDTPSTYQSAAVRVRSPRSSPELTEMSGTVSGGYRAQERDL